MNGLIIDIASESITTAFNTAELSHWIVSAPCLRIDVRID